jgi:toxin ParE1/3/4
LKIVFLASVYRDLEWYSDDYATSFPQGQQSAQKQYLKSKALLRRFPEAGRPSDAGGLLELVIGKTPFMFVYAIKDTHIEILRVWDQRAKRPKTWARSARQKKK